MTLQKLSIRVLTPLYLVMLLLALPLVWLQDSALRDLMASKRHYGLRRKWRTAIALAKQGAKSLGVFLPCCMAVPAAIAGYVFGSALAVAMGALFGLMMLSMLPVLVPMPSSLAVEVAQQRART